MNFTKQKGLDWRRKQSPPRDRTVKKEDKLYSGCHILDVGMN